MVGDANSVSEMGTPALSEYVSGVGPRSLRMRRGRLSSAAIPALRWCAPATYDIENRCLKGRCPRSSSRGPLPLNGKLNAVSRYNRAAGMPAHGLSNVLYPASRNSTPASNSSLLLVVLDHVAIAN